MYCMRGSAEGGGGCSLFAAAAAAAVEVEAVAATAGDVDGAIPRCRAANCSGEVTRANADVGLLLLLTNSKRLLALAATADAAAAIEGKGVEETRTL